MAAKTDVTTLINDNIAKKTTNVLLYGVGLYAMAGHVQQCLAGAPLVGTATLAACYDAPKWTLVPVP
jgi:hypothetical protein